MYLIKPTIYNVNCIAADFTCIPCRYSACHVFFLPPVPSIVVHKLKNSNAGKYLRRIEDAYLDFRPLESQVYTLNDPRSLEKLYSSECHDLVTSTIDKIALQLVSACTALGEYPIVRFYNPDKPNYEAYSLSHIIAQKFQNQIDLYAGNHENFPDNSPGRLPSILLIMDRSIDFISPIIHDFTYQALAYDLLEFKNWNKVMYSTQKKDDGKSKPLEGKVSEKDPDWVSLRHEHIADVSSKFTEKVQKLLKDNPHFVNQDTNVTVGDLKDMIFSLPGFKEDRDRYTMHLDIASGCMTKIETKDLKSVSVVEQTLATGFSEDGTKPKTITDDFVAVLADERLDHMDRVRLILLYAIFRHGLVEADYQRLQQHCGLSNDDIQIIRNYTKIGAPTIKASSKIKLSKSDLSHRFHSMNTKGYMTSRYVCGIYNVIDQLLTGKLSADLFPYTKEQPINEEESAAAAVGINSLRNTHQRAVWALNPTAQPAKQRIFIFVAGGITASEAKATYELSKIYNREIIIGGNDIIAPRQFLTSLLNLSKPRPSLNLEEDKKIAESAPNFLLESDRQKPSISSPITKPTPRENTFPSVAKPISTISSSVEPPKHEKEKKKGKLKSLFKS